MDTSYEKKLYNNEKKLYNIEFVRFIFSAMIIYYHLLHNNLITVTDGGTAFLNRLADDCEYAGFIVECFFIIAGYFLFRSYSKRPDLSVKEFAYNKIARLWPVLFVTVVIGVLFFGENEIPSLFNVLFLQCIGVSLDYQGITWYVSPFFWAILFYFVLLKCARNKKMCNVLIGVISYFSYVLLVNRFFGRETINDVFSLGVVRALGGIGVGYLIGVCLNSIQNMPAVKDFRGTKTQNLLIGAAFSLAEIASAALLMRHFLSRDNTYGNQFFIVILFSVLLVCMISGRGILSRIFNNKIFGFAGKYAYSIYMMQQIAFWILKDTLWKNTDFIRQHGLWCIAISLIFAILLGILTYYAVEKPAANALKKLGAKLFKK